MSSPALGADQRPGDPGDASDAEPGVAGGDDARDAALQAWRRWRVPLVLIGVIIIGGIVIAVISRLLPPPGPNSYLDPASTAPDGAHALTDILGDRGYDVIRAYSASSAVAALSSGPGVERPSAGGPATLVVTSPYRLTHPQLVRLGRSEADLVVVEAGPGSLTTLAPRVRLKHALTGRFGQLLR